MKAISAPSVGPPIHRESHETSNCDDCDALRIHLSAVKRAAAIRRGAEGRALTDDHTHIALRLC